MEDEEQPRQIRIGRLTSVGRVGIEMGRIYRAARHGKISSTEGVRLCQMLTGLKGCLEVADVEARLEAIEQALTRTSKPGLRVV